MNVDTVGLKTTREDWRAWLRKVFISFWGEMKDVVVSLWEKGKEIFSRKPAHQMIKDH